MAYVSSAQQPPMQYANTTTVVAQPMMTGPVMAPQIPQQRLNINVIKGLGITQIVIGIISISIGLGTTVGLNKDYWVNDSAGGIWGGGWILLTGIIGVCLAFNPNNGGLLGTHMAFCIISTVVVFFDGIFFAVALAFYNNCDLFRSIRGNYDNYYYNYRYDTKCSKDRDAGRALYSLLIILMVTEFFVALVASIYSCNSTQCCGQSSPGVIIQQQPVGQAQYIMTSSSGQTYMTPGPAVYNPQQGAMMPQSTPVSSAPYATYPHQTAYTNPATTTAGVTYSQEQDAYKSGPPPVYTPTA